MATLPKCWTKQKEGMYLNDVSKSDNNRLQVFKKEGDSSKPIHKMDKYERAANGYKVVLFKDDTTETVASDVGTKEDAISEAYDYMENNPASLGGSSSSESGEENETMGLKFKLAKPVRARSYYDPRFTGGLGDDFSKHRKDKPLYVPGEKKDKGIQHTSDVKRTTATGDTVLFIKPQDEERSWEQLEEAVNEAVGGLPTQRIYMYDGVLGGEDNRVKALKTSPEQAVEPDMLKTMADKHGYPASGRGEIVYVGDIPV